MRKIANWAPDMCDHCGQSKTYLLGIDHGTYSITRKIADAISAKGVNAVHPRKEGVLNTTEWCNIARPRFHGLIARVRGESGVYCLTRKGAAFLRGGVVPRYAIVSKSEHKQIGYVEPEVLTITVQDLSSAPYWEGADVGEEASPSA